MISFKHAIREWEAPLDEKMIGYSALTRKACNDPTAIFVVAYWDDEKKTMMHQSLDVGLRKRSGRWLLNKESFRDALTKKINYIEDSNTVGKTNINICYPEWAVKGYLRV